MSSMKIRERNGRWEYRFSVRGDRVSRVTDWVATEANRKRAEQAATQHRDQILQGMRPAKEPPARRFSEAVEEFMQAVQVQHQDKPATVHRVATSMVSARLFFGQRTLCSLRPADIERYKIWRLSGDEDQDLRPVAPITLRHDLDNLSKLFQWAQRMELATANPVRDVRRPSAEDAVRMHVLTPAEEFLYFERARVYPHLYDLARLMLLQGLRPEEVLRLERADVDLAQNRLTVRRARRGQHIEGKSPAAARALRMAPETRLIVERRLAGNSPWLFPSPVRPGAHLTKLNGLHNKVCAPPPTPQDPQPVQLRFVLYDLRHTFATRAAPTTPIATLARILGHSNLRSIGRYVHPSQAEMDAAMDQLAAGSAAAAPEPLALGVAPRRPQ